MLNTIEIQLKWTDGRYHARTCTCIVIIIINSLGFSPATMRVFILVFVISILIAITTAVYLPSSPIKTSSIHSQYDRILVVIAHPDDLECICGGLIALQVMFMTCISYHGTGKGWCRDRGGGGDVR